MIYVENRRIITSSFQTEDIEVEQKLRPETLDNYIGQENIKSNMKIFMQMML